MNLAPRQSDHLDDNEVELAGSNVSQRKKCVSEDGRIFNEKEDGVDASIGGLAGGAVIHRLSYLRKCASVQVCKCASVSVCLCKCVSVSVQVCECVCVSVQVFTTNISRVHLTL